METKIRKPQPDIIKRLLKQSSDFSFMQAIRLLALQLNPEHETLTEKSIENLRIRTNLSLDFPSSDISQLEELTLFDKNTYQLTVNFLGLYGTASPLPTFYTEDLLQDKLNDNNLAREFIDIFGNHIYQLFIKIFCRNKISLQIFEFHNKDYLSFLYSLGGLTDINIQKTISDKYNILRYIGIMGHLPRSALGLKVILTDLLEISNIEIYQCSVTIIQIPPEQRFSLGGINCYLGDDSHLGNEIASATAGFTVNIGPVTYEQYLTFLPGTEKFKTINDIIGLYIDQPLTWDIKVKVQCEGISTTCLGNEISNSLGNNTWLFANNMPKPPEYTINLK